MSMWGGSGFAQANTGKHKLVLWLKLLGIVPLYLLQQTMFVGGYTVFTLSVRACVCPSVTFCFFNIFFI